LKKNAYGKFIVVLIAAIISLFCAFSPLAPLCDCTQVADAILPQSYVDRVSDLNYDWWTGEKYINLPALKQTVAKWFKNDLYDFEYLKRNPVIVGIIDTGVNVGHDLFLGNYDENGYAAAYESLFGGDLKASPEAESGAIGKYDVLARDADGNIIKRNTDESTDDITDTNSHGTHVAGIVAILIHELNLEDYIKILPIKADNAATGKFSDTAVRAGITFAIANGADVINMSLASDNANFSIVTAEQAKQAVFVAAAGNDKSSNPYYPAAHSNVIGVMNYMNGGLQGIKLSDSSNYGSYYDLCAPGTNIYSSDNETTALYKAKNGTSMASPVVAFAAALATAKYRAIEAAVGFSKTPEEITSLVRKAYSSKIKKNNAELKVFDMLKLVEGYDHAAKVEAVDKSRLSQLFNDVKTVDFELKVYPSSDEEIGSVKWYVNDALIGSGSRFVSVTPSNEIGTTVVKAVWTLQLAKEIVLESSATISVDYFEPTKENIASVSVELVDLKDETEDTAFEIGKTYKLRLNVSDQMSEADRKRIMWYENGVFKRVEEEYSFTPLHSGEYEINVKVGGQFSKSITINVKASGGKSKTGLFIFTGVCGAIIVTVVIIVIIAVAAAQKKKKRAGE